MKINWHAISDDRLESLEFLAIRNRTWGDAPNADWLELRGIVGYSPRGMGNADTYMYVLRINAYCDYQVALIDNAKVCELIGS